MSDYEQLEYETREGAAIVRFDRPEKHNAFGQTMIGELIDALRRAEDEDAVRAVVLTGNGESFSAGYDLSTADVGEESAGIEGQLWDPRRPENRHVTTIVDLHVPVIAAVNGHALAGGSDVAGICDITIASEDAEFGYPAVRIGSPPVTLTYPFVMSSPKYASELLLTGKTVDAAEARRMGWVNRTVPPDRLVDEALEEVEHIRKVPSAVVRLLKRKLAAVRGARGFYPQAYNEDLAALAHYSEASREFSRIVEQEGMSAAFEYMYEADKA